jgi:hypothetical protein
MITILCIIYLYLIEDTPYFVYGALVIFMVFTGPMGLLSTALYYAIYEDEDQITQVCHQYLYEPYVPQMPSPKTPKPQNPRV